MKLPTWITFDCYGTLCQFPIDLAAREILGPRASGIDYDAFRNDFARLRFETTTYGPYKPYRDVLRETLAQMMRDYGLAYRDEDGEALLAAVRAFGPFPEAPAALRRLRARCNLAIISNSDDDLIASNVGNIGVPIDRVITAEQAGAYKPSPVIFAYALRALECEPADLLHVAQGFAYDIVPCHELGWPCVWINRNGLPSDPAYRPYDELPDLSGLPDLLGL
jgi:2-haloacid dehalogenase